METKKDIRKKYLKERDCLSEQVRIEKSHIIAQKVISNERFYDSDVILCYINFRSEVVTSEIIDQAISCQKKIAVPRVEGETMHFYYIEKMDDLRNGYMGILEPKDQCQKVEDYQSALMIVPGSVFDAKCNRMGYGKGFYDRYLACHGGIFTIGICYEEQLTEDLPTEETDWQLDMVITDCRSYIK